MIYKPFDIVVVPFPFSDEEGRHKYRPALVLSNQKFNKENKSLLLAMITSAKKSQFFGDHKITDYRSTNLQKDCVVRLKLFTLDIALIKAKIGNLGKSDSSQIAKNLRAIF